MRFLQANMKSLFLTYIPVLFLQWIVTFICYGSQCGPSGRLWLQLKESHWQAHDTSTTIPLSFRSPYPPVMPRGVRLPAPHWEGTHLWACQGYSATHSCKKHCTEEARTCPGLGISRGFPNMTMQTKPVHTRLLSVNLHHLGALSIDVGPVSLGWHFYCYMRRQHDQGNSSLFYFIFCLLFVIIVLSFKTGFSR